MKEHTLPDFAIGEFPVTFGEYIEFLDSLAPSVLERRIPRERNVRDAHITKVDGVWQLTDYAVEGDGRKRVEGRLNDLPAVAISYFNALAYTEWLSEHRGRTYRLPTSLEWDKAARGVDGRAFPMGPKIDPVFAKLRESRPETSQLEPVGAFRLDVSPFGTRDIVGGVQDWTSTMNDGEQAPALTAEEVVSTQHRQAVIRGGSWPIIRMEPRIGLGLQRLIDRTGWVGFRVVVGVLGPSSSLRVSPMLR
jgi:serine/threonine-protein kinase